MTKKSQIESDEYLAYTERNTFATLLMRRLKQVLCSHTWKPSGFLPGLNGQRVSVRECSRCKKAKALVV